MLSFVRLKGSNSPYWQMNRGLLVKPMGLGLNFISLRHSFIIDPEGILRERFVKVSPVIHSQEVLARLTELQQESAAS